MYGFSTVKTAELSTSEGYFTVGIDTQLVNFVPRWALDVGTIFSQSVEHGLNFLVRQMTHFSLHFNHSHFMN